MTDVVLLDPTTDLPCGRMEKLAAHRAGAYHAAISILLFVPGGAQVLQQRALSKYHGGGLWSNACCSHPLPDEDPADTAARRLEEELGIRCILNRFGTIRYRAAVFCGPARPSLVEYEHVTLFAGVHDGGFTPDPAEVSAIRAGLGNAKPLTPWFRLYMSPTAAHMAGDAWRAARDEHPERDYGFFDLLGITGAGDDPTPG